MIRDFVAAVPYANAPIDFAALLSSVRDVKVSRKGPQRRVQISLDESRMEKVKSLLPSHVIIEQLAEFKSQENFRRAGSWVG
jgi:hypothetical protein